MNEKIYLNDIKNIKNNKFKDLKKLFEFKEINYNKKVVLNVDQINFQYLKSDLNQIVIKRKINVYRKFISLILKNGKKLKAVNFFFKTLLILKLKYKKPSNLIIKKALKKLQSYFFIKKYYIAGKVKYIPFILNEKTSISRAIKWLVKASRLFNKKNFFFENLAYEIMNALQGKGEAIKFKMQLYSLCYDYRTYIGFGKKKKNLWKKKMLKFLSRGKKRISGRGLFGNIIMYNRGGGNKKKYRFIDFRRKVWNVNGQVLRIEKDSNRSGYIFLIYYKNGILVYILGIEGVKIGDVIKTSDLSSNLKNGDTTFLKFLPLGSFISNIEVKFNSGGKIHRSAGCFGKIIKQNINYTLIKLKSGELKYFLSNILVNIGRVSNIQYKTKKFLKAGFLRNLGFKPKVRAAAKNPVDHPLGGRTRGGKIPKSRWGLIKGVKTVKKQNKFIIKKRYD